MTAPTDSPVTILSNRQDGDLLLEFEGFESHPVHNVPTYFFRMVHADGLEEAGRINLRHASTPHIERYAGHVGFSVHPRYRGRRYASRALNLIIPLAKQLGLNPLWITCDPDNIPSRRSCERIGAEFAEIVSVPPDCIIHQNGHPRKCRYRLAL